MDDEAKMTSSGALRSGQWGGVLVHSAFSDYSAMNKGRKAGSEAKDKGW
jgi:hypothetical protein